MPAKRRGLAGGVVVQRSLRGGGITASGGREGTRESFLSLINRSGGDARFKPRSCWCLKLRVRGRAGVGVEDLFSRMG